MLKNMKGESCGYNKSVTNLTVGRVEISSWRGVCDTGLCAVGWIAGSYQHHDGPARKKNYSQSQNTVVFCVSDKILLKVQLSQQNSNVQREGFHCYWLQIHPLFTHPEWGTQILISPITLKCLCNALRSNFFCADIF